MSRLRDRVQRLKRGGTFADFQQSCVRLLREAGREDQLRALQEAQHEARGKKTTAKQTREVVRRRQEATTVPPERDGHRKAAEVARAALPKRLSQLCDLVEAWPPSQI